MWWFWRKPDDTEVEAQRLKHEAFQNVKQTKLTAIKTMRKTDRTTDAISEYLSNTEKFFYAMGGRQK